MPRYPYSVALEKEKEGKKPSQNKRKQRNKRKMSIRQDERNAKFHVRKPLVNSFALAFSSPNSPSLLKERPSGCSCSCSFFCLLSLLWSD